MRKYLIVFAMLTLLLSACRIETNISLDIEEDGSATVGAEIGFDEEFQQFLGDAGASPDEIFTDLPGFGDEDVETTERVDGDMTYYGVTTEVDDLSTYDMNQAGNEGFNDFEFSSDDDTATLRATLASTDLEGLGGGEDFPIDPSMITSEFFSASLVVMMPGTVTEHDADEVRSDGALVWNIPLSGTKSVFATSDFGGSSGSVVLIVLAIVLLVGIIAAVVATIVSRRESEKAVAEAAATSKASDSTDHEPDTASSVGTAAMADDIAPGTSDHIEDAAEPAATAEASAPATNGGPAGGADGADGVEPDTASDDASGFHDDGQPEKP